MLAAAEEEGKVNQERYLLQVAQATKEAPGREVCRVLSKGKSDSTYNLI